MQTDLDESEYLIFDTITLDIKYNSFHQFYYNSNGR